MREREEQQRRAQADEHRAYLRMAVVNSGRKLTVEQLEDVVQRLMTMAIYVNGALGSLAFTNIRN